MEERELNRLIDKLDDDLFAQELDVVMTNIDIDVDAIARKARRKLRKGNMNMYKKRIVAVASAALVIAGVGVTSVYADDISAFLRSLTDKTSAYGTVVDGASYYLEAPVELGGGDRLDRALFNEGGLDILLRADRSADVKVVADGTEYEPTGFMGEEGGMTLTFFGVAPVDSFQLILNGTVHPIALASTQSVTAGLQVVEAEPGGPDWMSMGYKKVEGGVQILTAFDEEDVHLNFLVSPESDRIDATFSENSSGHQYQPLRPLYGTDDAGNVYEYNFDPHDSAPYTVFTSDAPADARITLKLPTIAVSKDLMLEGMTVALPPEGEAAELDEHMDLGLQAMNLKRVERTGPTSARFTFALNTGTRKDVRVWNASLDAAEAESGTLVWENGVCTMDIVIPAGTDAVNLRLAMPSFLVDGDWTMIIQ